MPKIVIYIKDVMMITGKSRASCQRSLARIRRQLGKPVGCDISIKEYCDDRRYKVEDIVKFLDEYGDMKKKEILKSKMRQTTLGF